MLIVVATSKCTIARSLSVNEILADSRSLSPFGEIVVTRVLSPWNGWRPRLWAVMFIALGAILSIVTGVSARTRKPSTSRTM